MFRSTAKGNIHKPSLKPHVFIILIVLFNMHEVILIWSQIFSSYQMSSYTLDGFLCIFFSIEIGLYYFTKFYQHLETNCKTVLSNLHMQEQYSGFPTSLLDKDYCFCASMGHFNPPLMKHTECFQCGLFVTLLCSNQVNNSLDLRDFSSEYLKSVTKRKVAKKIGSLLQHI